MARLDTCKMSTKRTANARKAAHCSKGPFPVFMSLKSKSQAANNTNLKEDREGGMLFRHQWRQRTRVGGQ
ncbi:hypothetical protein SERLA73DRAFT_119976 [Serpula lacrymans var. lacrymans S7.3]|uniref:Uncharacterized protein n=2 Tax=Serpula lacrymans var. lacrymans TaxID=341189 RepID=F8PMY0_SERL3|nr:uncharacterized protein SERLADRAFT_366356 [Serpula lacrymans var. lacrymans S7.9]EGO02962.1 hypothetical protein SERLA73DRAFT_119976 [Serpula lacrymans var. lacrymans S7.3]EGO28645.1 hypothetical protein SERLADRAFT_366356 [Serpula lacrymans var. lacrymans S7.9]